MSSTDHSTAQQSQPQSQQTSGLRNSVKLVLGGSVFFAFSVVITRRALARRRIASTLTATTTHSPIPPNAAHPHAHPQPHAQAAAEGAGAGAHPRVSGPMEALEALNIATINVASLAMIGVGAGMYLFDIETLEDLRRKVRGGLGADGTGRSEQEVEEEWEEWIASRLARKEEREERRRREGYITGEVKWVNERGKER
ncbi:hypothetical protein VTO42DRAFT_479 [Malbranchea cinnamomea]